MGVISSDDLLVKIEEARATLQRQGKEWERSEEPPPEGQEDRSLKVLGTPRLAQDTLHSYLTSLRWIALFAGEVGSGVKRKFFV